jgi:hypothetical protein
MEARSLVVGQCPVVGFPPSELEPHAEGLVQIPEQVAIEGAVADSSRGGDIAVNRIINPVSVNPQGLSLSTTIGAGS